jgi:hypothetical protein
MAKKASRATRDSQRVSGVQGPDSRGGGDKEWSQWAPEPRNPDAGWSPNPVARKEDQSDS